MTEREKVLAAVSHRPARSHAVPHQLHGAGPTGDGFYGDGGFEKALGNCLEVLRMRLPYRQLADKPSVWEDEWGVQWDRSIDTDIGTVCNRRITAQTIGQYRFPIRAPLGGSRTFPRAYARAAAGSS